MAPREQSAVRKAETDANDTDEGATPASGSPARPRLEDVTARRTKESPDTVADAPAATGSRWARLGRRQKIFAGLGAVAVIALAAFGTHYFLVGRYMISTDDAYVRANNTMLGARASGYLAKIAVGDNTEVKAGDLLFQIDDGDYKIAVDNARAKIATQEATIKRIARQAVAQQSAVEQAQAQLESTQAAAKRAEADYVRQSQLSEKGFASKATFDQSLATRDQSNASVQGAQANLDAAQAQIDVIKAQQAEAEGQLGELKTALAKAERDLSFTTIRAPIDGVFSNRLVNEGDNISVGQRLANVVPLDDVYIDANFKETQLARIRPGQPVYISVDAVKGRDIVGTVESLSPASGSVFTLLPPDNATGNFTKIVQRLPVRVRVPKAIAHENLLRAGMSVVVDVDTRQSAKQALAKVE
ncbi:HlyD family secretion protein [Afipia felis]|uniref:Inner membrane protein yiaV n=2 Tax=Afipia felis TaxID=1035 RepID=A0A380W5A8_AFIFE|nr:HlyD family secretion protein [Afipia felis]EKS31322.1 efflux pump membrane protein [Afipia felis ATCC 53690]SUU76064.1 Inner membrane protein yiaV precursor [Afipia felis]SUU84131.1 Inner membrane protein yiaV precursor [Afipia felis]